MTEKYHLIKISAPGFSLYTNHIHHVHNMLDMYVCKSCREKHVQGEVVWQDWPDDYYQLDQREQVGWLLSTSCGAEFDLEEDGQPAEWEVVHEDIFE